MDSTIKEGKVKLYNHSTSPVAVTLEKRSKIIQGAHEGVPYMDFFTWEDVEYLYNRGTAITSALLEPEMDKRQEFYEALNFVDWKDKLFFHEQVDALITKTTLEMLQRIIDIRDVQMFDILRGKVIAASNAGVGVDTRLISVVNERFAELCNGIKHSKITLKKKATPEEENNKVLEAVKQENDNLKQRLEALEKMLTANTAVAAPAPEPTKTESEAEPVKKPARKASK